MRVTIDISPWMNHHAGLGRYAGELTRALREVAPGNEYIGLYHAPHVLEPAAPLANLKTRRVPLSAKPWRMSVLLAYAAGRNFDAQVGPTEIFHATDHLLPPLAKAKTVFTIHDLIFRFFPEYHLPLNRWYLALMLPRFMRRADAIIAVSEQTRRDVEQLMHIPAGKIRVIYEGVSPSFRPVQDSAERARVRAAYRLPPQFILFFSTIEPRKNLVTLLDAYAALVRQEASTPPLVVAGRRGWLYNKTLEHIRTLGLAERVRLTDWVAEDDVPALMSMAEVFVYPSLYEGFGLPPLEAMACGTPVISSDAASLKEVVGEAGLVVGPRDTAALTRTLARVLEEPDLRENLRQRGLRQAARFRWDQAARETLAVYEELAKS